MSVRGGATHACPGCGAQVSNRYYACGGCWYRLPRPLRDEINAAHRVRMGRGGWARYSTAVRVARDWYRDNPPHPSAVAT